MTATGQALPLLDLPLLEPIDLQWSADQRWITLTGMQENGNWDIYRVRPNGSDLRNLSNAPGEDTMPVFSKDGSWIIFASTRRDRYFNLYRMRPDGSHQEQ